MQLGSYVAVAVDPMLLWPAAEALIGPLAWESPYAMGAAQEMAKRQKKEKTEAESATYTKGHGNAASLTH